MPITMQYGPISAALGLAQQAGNGQGFAEQRSAQLQAQQLAQQAQDELDKQYSTQVQDTMQQQNEQQQNQQSQGAMAQKAAMDRAQLQLQQQQEQSRNLQLQQQIGYQNGMLGVQQQNANTKTSSATNTADYRQGELGNQQVAMENRSDEAMSRSLTAQASSLQTSIRAAEVQYDKVSKDPLADPDAIKSAKNLVDTLKSQLVDSVDPSTGQTIPGLTSAIKFTQARLQKRQQAAQQPQQPQQQNQGLAPGSFNYQGTLRPRGQAAGAQAPLSSSAPQITPESTGGLAPPELYKPLFAGVAAQLKLPQNDPKVVEAVKQQLHTFGYIGMIPS